MTRHSDPTRPAGAPPPGRFDALDRSISAVMQRWGVPCIRLSFGVIFIWFGLLKLLGLSSAEPLVLSTVAWMPLLDAGTWLHVIGWWEVAIGITFLFRSSLRLAIALLAGQMVGTFLPLVILPSVTFQAGHVPYAPTIEGQYIIKNLMVISAGLVVGGTVGKFEGTPGFKAPRSMGIPGSPDGPHGDHPVS